MQSSSRAPELSATLRRVYGLTTATPPGSEARIALNGVSGLEKLFYLARSIKRDTRQDLSLLSGRHSVISTVSPV